ncbi:hypothetical protein [Actinomadura luteofluorescens]|uniref:hypothetical protein n=1 Tax=Actinomadura luteofluorescens TaxID=46163 RepID=UPI003D93B096
MAGEMPDVVERFVADVDSYVRDLERAAREADHFGDQQDEAREAVRRMGHAAEDAAERAARAQAEAAREAERLAEGTGDVERAARAAARAQRELERAEMAQSRAARAASQQVDREADQYRELAREAARAAAEQRLAQMRASGQFREHNQLLRRLRQEYGDFGDEFNRNFREMESRARQTFNGFRESGIGAINPVIAALVLLPTIAAVAGGAITFAVGGALAGIGIMAAAQNAKVKASFSGLKKHVVSELKSWSTPFQATLLEISQIAERTFDAFGPDLQRIFAELAPAVGTFVDQTAKGFERFRPMIHDFSAGFQAILADLGPRMDAILGNLADGLSALAQAARENPEAFGQLLEDVSELAKFCAQLTPILASLSGGFHDVMNIVSALGSVLGPFTGLLQEGAKSFLAFSNPVSGVAYALSKTKEAFQEAGHGAQEHTTRMRAVDTSSRAAAAGTGRANDAQTRSGILMKLASQSAQKLKASLDELAGKEMSSREAAAQYGTAVLALNKSLKENGKNHGFATAKGIANEQALDTLAQSAQQNAVAMRDNGRSAKDVAKFMEQSRRKFVETAIAMGYNKDEANKLADKLYGVRNAANKIPAKKHTKVTADTKEAEGGIRGFISWVGQQVARVRISALWGHKDGGLIGGLADGGPAESARRISGTVVRGPGTGTSDSILARLSNGEFVNTARATRMFGPVLAMMNKVASGRGSVGAGQDVQRSGGIRRGGVGAIEQGRYTTAPPPRIYAPLPRAAAPATIHVTNNHFTIQGSVWAEQELFSVVQRQAANNNARNPGLAQFGSR